MGRYTQPDPIGLGGGINMYGYATQSPLRLTDRFGLSAEDVKNIVNHIDTAFPEVNRTGGWKFGEPGGGANAYTETLSGQIVVDKYYAKDCLTLDEFLNLYFQVLHESMHSTDPWWQRMWDGFWDPSLTRNHEAIHHRVQYEEKGIVIDDNLWGVPDRSGLRPPIEGSAEELYRKTRNCECMQ